MAWLLAGGGARIQAKHRGAPERLRLDWPLTPLGGVLSAPKLQQRPVAAVDRIGVGKGNFGNERFRPRVLGRRGAAKIVGALRRIGADDEEIAARRNALVPGARGEHLGAAGFFFYVPARP